MDNVSISQFKINPAAVLAQAETYPVSITAHNQIKAYVVGRELYEQMVAQFEDQFDRQAIADTDFSKGKDLEILAKELGL